MTKLEEFKKRLQPLLDNFQRGEPSQGTWRVWHFKLRSISPEDLTKAVSNAIDYEDRYPANMVKVICQHLPKHEQETPPLPELTEDDIEAGRRFIEEITGSLAGRMSS